MSRRRTFTVLSLVVGATLVAPACGIGDKQSYADRIHLSREKAVDAKVGSGTLTFELAPDPDNPAPIPGGDDEGAAALLAGGSQTMTMSFKVDFDFTKRLAQLTAAEAEGEPTVATVFSGETIFVRRANLRPTERRHWAKLDFTALPDDEPRPLAEELDGPQAVIAAANTLNPIYFVDLALGALAGSIEPVGTEDVAGVSTTKYESNMSIDRVFNELDLEDTELEARLLMVRLLLNRPVDVVPAQFWVDDDGLLRKARFEFSQRIDRDENNDLVITLELPTYGGEIGITTPASDETVEVERYGRMVRAATPRQS